MVMLRVLVSSVLYVFNISRVELNSFAFLRARREETNMDRGDISKRNVSKLKLANFDKFALIPTRKFPRIQKARAIEYACPKLTVQAEPVQHMCVNGALLLLILQTKDSKRCFSLFSYDDFTSSPARLNPNVLPFCL